MLNRREVLAVAGATAALTGIGGRLGSLSAQQRLTQDDLLRFDAKGRLTLLHLTDCHAQLKPIYFREPSVNIGVGAMSGLPPHLTDSAFLEKYGVDAGSCRPTRSPRMTSRRWRGPMAGSAAWTAWRRW
jgi:S-sulfosulfanyl-L-cysteine sulfohydrolase